MASSYRDPRINCPPCLSLKMGDERRKALVARDREAREAFMDRYRNPVARRSLWARVLGR